MERKRFLPAEATMSKFTVGQLVKVSYFSEWIGRILGEDKDGRYFIVSLNAEKTPITDETREYSPLQTYHEYFLDGINCTSIPLVPVSVTPAWLTWNDGTVVKIAQSISEEGRFDRLPILADALEDSGCNNPDILSHCRSEVPHIPGCWVLQMLLGTK